MDHSQIAETPQNRLGFASDALLSMQQALKCLDVIAAHQCGAHLDYTIHLFRQWCAAQDGLELLGAPGGRE